MTCSELDGLRARTCPRQKQSFKTYVGSAEGRKSLAKQDEEY